MFSSEDFDIQTALLAAVALKTILARRTHKKVILGEERLVPGTLGEVINLPKITQRLDNRSSRLREQGLEDFKALWETLSDNTRQSVLEAVGWYEPDELGWDDKRSNRRPDIHED